MKKIKVFLGGVVNISNAQNNNCRSLIRYLDKEKFELYALQSSRAKKIRLDGVETLFIREPIKVFKYFSFAWGIFKCDVAYLPKTECMTWNRFICKIFKKKYFRTIESIVEIKSGKVPNNISDYRKTENLYSITRFMKDYNEKNYSITSKNKILYLGVDEKNIMESPTRSGIKNVVIVGHDLKRKGLYDYLSLARSQPSIVFHIVGSGNNKINVKELVRTHNQEMQTDNVVYHGSLPSDELEAFLGINVIDLLILPSHNEGFPKVILECARFAIPSLLYSTYGAREWIENDSNGFVCDTFDEMANKLNELTGNVRLLSDVSSRSVTLYEAFKWSSRVKNWEEEIIKIWRS